MKLLKAIDAVKNRELNSLKEILLFDGYKIPFDDNIFQYSIATYVLEHIEHERAFLREMARVSNKIIVSVPLEHTRKIMQARKAGKTIGHINFYTKETFRNVLETSGLFVEDLIVYTTSKEYEVFCSPRFGAIKYFLRNLTLSILPKLSGYLFTYMAIALCSPIKKN